MGGEPALCYTLRNHSLSLTTVPMVNAPQFSARLPETHWNDPRPHPRNMETESTTAREPPQARAFTMTANSFLRIWPNLLFNKERMVDTSAKTRHRGNPTLSVRSHWGGQTTECPPQERCQFVSPPLPASLHKHLQAVGSSKNL